MTYETSISTYLNLDDLKKSDFGLINKFKNYQKDSKFLAKYRLRNAPEVTKPFLTVMGQDRDVIHFGGSHIFLLNDSFELSLYLKDIGFSILPSQYSNFKWNQIDIEEYYNASFNISLILVPSKYFDELKLAIKLAKRVSSDIGKDNDILLKTFFDDIIINSKV